MDKMTFSAIPRTKSWPKFDPLFWSCAVYLFLLLLWLGKNRLLGLDESMYAGVILAEARDHHWLPMTFEGHPFWEKAPLLLWLQGLAVWLGGANEFSLRLMSALSGVLCFYFVARLGAYFAGNPWIGLACAWLVGFEEHFILYARLATMDMGLVACLMGSWWGMAQAFDPLLKEKAPQKLLMAGLFSAAAIGCKSWFGLVLLPAIGVALWFCRPWPFSTRQFLARFVAPILASLAFWLLLYSLAYGKDFWSWEWDKNVLTRLKIGEFSYGLQGDGGFHWMFYAVIAQSGLAFLWPLAPLGFFLWIKEVWQNSRARRFSLAPIVGVLFFFYYLFFILSFMAILINYLFPLVPVAALAPVFIFRHSERPKVALAGALACLLGVMSGWGGDSYLSVLLGFSFGLILLALLPVPWHWAAARKVFELSLVVLLLAAGLKAQDYLRHPPDPNHAWVAAVLAHPARYSGEPLLFVGEHTNARALEFYSGYRVTALYQLPSERPKEAILFPHQNEAVFYPAQP